MLRGVNVGGNNKIKMEDLRALCADLGCSDVQTYVNSGNAVFRSPAKGGSAKDRDALGKRIEAAIETTCGFRTPVVLRSAEELRRVVKGNPFPAYALSAPGKLHVNFLYADPGEARRQAVRAMKFDPEELRLDGREIYIYYPEGAGQSKLRWSVVDKALGTSGTARNWNTVLKLLEMAERLE